MKNEPTGRLKHAYNTIAIMEAKIKELEKKLEHPTPPPTGDKSAGLKEKTMYEQLFDIMKANIEGLTLTIEQLKWYESGFALATNSAIEISEKQTQSATGAMVEENEIYRRRITELENIIQTERIANNRSPLTREEQILKP